MTLHGILCTRSVHYNTAPKRKSFPFSCSDIFRDSRQAREFGRRRHSKQFLISVFDLYMKQSCVLSRFYAKVISVGAHSALYVLKDS